MVRSHSSRLSLTSLHDAARKGDSRSLQRLITVLDPTAAEEVAAILLKRKCSGKSLDTSSAGGTDPSLDQKTRVARRKPGSAKTVPANPLKRLLQKQDTKRRTALYVACAAGNTEVTDTLLAVGASSEGHGAWQRTPLHIAAYEAHTSAIRSLLGAGADPSAVNGRGQTPSDVNCMYNANGQVLELLEQAVDMRRVIATGTAGLIGTTFVHDDGQVGSVAAAVEQWSFTLEVKVDRWEMGNGSRAKVYLPVRGRRHHTSTRPSSGNMTASIGRTKASSTRPQPRRCTQSIPWMAKAVSRMRLQSDGLLKVDADSLVGARAYTPIGWGAVMSVRDVSLRCEIETSRTNTTTTGVGNFAGKTTSTSCSTGDGANLDDGEGQRILLGGKTRARNHSGTTGDNHSLSPSVLEREPTGSSGNPSENESSRRRDDLGGRNEDGSESPGWGKRRDKSCEHAKYPPTAVFKSCLHERVVHVADRKGLPEEGGPYCLVGDDGQLTGSGDDNDKRDAWEGCSEATERAAEHGQWGATTAHERTRDDFEPELIGPGSWVGREGAHSRRHAFLDNLVPLDALAGVIDYHTLTPSATTWQSRARRRRQFTQNTDRVPASRLAANQTYQQQTAKPQQWPTPTMLEVDDIFRLGLDQATPHGSIHQEKGHGRNEAQVEIIGLEEQIERKERSEERMDEKRINMEATRSVVVEALALWRNKADLLQARLVIVRAMTTTLSTVSGPTNSTNANNSEQNCVKSLAEHLASPVPRCCACDKRGGYWKAKGITLTVPPSSTPSSIAVPASSETVDDATGRSSSNDGGKSNYVPGLSARASNNQSNDDSLVNGDVHRGSMDPREEQLVLHLQDCLEHMTHLRDWLRFLDQELV